MPCGTCHLACKCREERIAGLVAAVENAPHDRLCEKIRQVTWDEDTSTYLPNPDWPCNCWKSRALKTYKGDES